VSGRRAFGLALGSMMGVQALAAMLQQAVPVMAPVAAPALGLAKQDVGYYTALTFLGANFAAVAGGLMAARWGAVRTSQVALGTCGLALVLFGSAWLPLVLLASWLMGVGYGPATPASSQVLSRLTPPAYANLVFSIKQTGVPLGHVLAGLLVPLLVTQWTWQTAAMVLGGGCIAFALALEPLRAQLDVERHATAPPLGQAIRRFFDPVVAVWRHPVMRRLALVSFVFASTQVSVIAFMVVYLEGDLGFSLVDAGLILAIGTAFGAGGRIAWGLLADATAKPLMVLTGLAAGMAAAALLLAAAQPGWSFAAVAAVAALAGVTTVGWNGVYFAEIARQSPPGQVGTMTGGAIFITYSGPLVVPPLFSLLLGWFGSFALNYLLAAAACSASGVVLWRLHRWR
jgi:MFS family permease